MQKKASTDVLFLCGLLFVTACGILSPEQAFSGFSNVAILTIAGLLADWELVEIIGNNEPKAPLSQIKVLSFKEKDEWILETKYNIGKKRVE